MEKAGKEGELDSTKDVQVPLTIDEAEALLNVSKEASFTKFRMRSPVTGSRWGGSTESGSRGTTRWTAMRILATWSE